MQRRAFLSGLAALSLAGACAGRSSAPMLAATNGRRRRLLVFTRSAGFVHSVVKPGPGGAPSLVDATMTALGARDGFDVVCTRDGGVFGSGELAGFDAFFFFTSGVLTEAGGDGQPPMTVAGKAALLDAVRGGKGFVGIHATTDSFHTQPDPADRSNRYVTHRPAVDPFLAMVGGEFIAHGAQQVAPVRVTDARFPGMGTFVDGAPRMGEWYSLKEFAPDLHVLMVLETAAMTGTFYQRGPFPVAWARQHERGRVYYSALGHREEEWADPAFVDSLRGATRWAFGDASADVTPNLTTAAPRHPELPPRP
jgi:uncharacterized protein